MSAFNDNRKKKKSPERKEDDGVTCENCKTVMKAKKSLAKTRAKQREDTFASPTSNYPDDDLLSKLFYSHPGSGLPSRNDLRKKKDETDDELVPCVSCGKKVSPAQAEALVVVGAPAASAQSRNSQARPKGMTCADCGPKALVPASNFEVLGKVRRRRPAASNKPPSSKKCGECGRPTAASTLGNLAPLKGFTAPYVAIPSPTVTTDSETIGMVGPPVKATTGAGFNAALNAGSEGDDENVESNDSSSKHSIFSPPPPPTAKRNRNTGLAPTAFHRKGKKKKGKKKKKRSGKRKKDPRRSTTPTGTGTTTTRSWSSRIFENPVEYTKATAPSDSEKRRFRMGTKYQRERQQANLQAEKELQAELNKKGLAIPTSDASPRSPTITEYTTEFTSDNKSLPEMLRKRRKEEETKRKRKKKTEVKPATNFVLDAGVGNDRTKTRPSSSKARVIDAIAVANDADDAGCFQTSVPYHEEYHQRRGEETSCANRTKTWSCLGLTTLLVALALVGYILVGMFPGLLGRTLVEDSWGHCETSGNKFCIKDLAMSWMVASIALHFLTIIVSS